MWKFDATFSGIIQQTSDVKTFRFDVGDKKGVTYRAGQFFYVTIKVGEEEAEHHFTLSSAPTETAEKGYIEFTKRITASPYSQALDRKKVGDWARVWGPEGDFVLPKGTKNLAFLSGGIGITPLRSMLRYIADKGLHHNVVLIYANNSYDNIAFRQELDEIGAKNDRIRVEYVLSGQGTPPGWKGKLGFITKELVSKLVPDAKERLFYLSGPLKMVLSLEEQLAMLGIPAEQVKRDYFPGYD